MQITVSLLVRFDNGKTRLFSDILVINPELERAEYPECWLEYMER